jgi:SAM-dependent methyltransferase
MLPMTADNVMISFKRLPIWKNVQDLPGITDYADFSLGWNPHGFIHQTTSELALKKVHDFYAKDGYSFITQPPGASSWANRLGDEYIDFIRTTCDSLQDRVVLEIGAGSLYIAEKLVEETGIAEYIVIDPAVKDSASNSKIQIYREYFDNASCVDKKVDIVVSLNCLEHIREPLGFLLRIHNLLKTSNGKAVLVFPDIKRQFDNGDFNAILHEHLNYFTEDTATHLINNCGLEVLACKTGFDTLRFLVELRKTELFNLQLDVKYPDDIFAKAAKQFNQNLKLIRQYLFECLSSDKPVAFYGANNGLNNIIALVNIPHTSNLWIFDNDEAKTGKYLPACQNPILHSKDTFCTSMSDVFVAANTFYDEINDFLRSYHGFSISHIHPLFPYEMDLDINGPLI